MRIAMAALALALAGAPAALAQEPVEHGAAHAPTGGEDAGVHELEEHGEHDQAAHHVVFIDDEDHDGTPNWLDPENGEVPNEDYQLLKLIQHLFNLILLLAVLGYFVRRPLGDALRNRSANIRKELTTAALLRDEAKQRHDEIEARLANFEEEVAAMRAKAESDAAAEEERLVARAKEEAERIRETAERNIADELVRARLALRREALDLAVQLAENTLRTSVQAEDQRRLARQFLDSLGAEEVKHG